MDRIGFRVRVLLGLVEVLHFLGCWKLGMRLNIWTLDWLMDDDDHANKDLHRVLRTARRMVERDDPESRAEMVNAIDLALEDLEQQ
jgi:hypothetical protein